MLRRAVIINLLLIVSLVVTNFAFADLILLKSGGVMQGKVLSEDKDSIKFKNSSGNVEVIKQDLIASLIRREEELSLSPEESYLKQSKLIPSTDAQGHYKLGCFCLENSLLDYALKELNQAREIDSQYEKPATKQIKYIESVKERAAKMIRVARKNTREPIPPLSRTAIKYRLEKDKLAVPNNQEDVMLIVEIINTFNDGELIEEYAQKYLELGSYSEKKQMSGLGIENGKLIMIPFCYQVAFWLTQEQQTRDMAQGGLLRFKDKLEKVKKNRILTPRSKADRDVIILFIKSFKGDEERSPYYGWYYEMAEEFKAKVKKTTHSNEKDRGNLEIAVYCYEIVQSNYVKNVVMSGIIEAKIIECAGKK